LRVEILGINRISDERFNTAATNAASILPWLQDTATENVWSRWGIEYRDVLIVDGLNRPVTTYNLSSRDLLQAANRQALKQLLLDAATIADTDQDGLPDVWETFWFQSLSPTPDSDPDADGVDNRTEFTFASNPVDPASGPLARPLLLQPGGRPALAVTFRRFAGSAATTTVETSPDLQSWSADRTHIFQVGSLVNLFDGMGGAEFRFQQTSASGALPTGFIRIRPSTP